MRKGVLLIIRDEANQFLLVQHTKDKNWGFVSGKIESGEDEITAIIRETQEEIGLEIDRDKIVNTGIVMKFDFKGSPAQYSWYEYTNRTETILLPPRPEEIFRTKWFDENDVARKIADKPLLYITFQKYLQDQEI